MLLTLLLFYKMPITVYAEGTHGGGSIDVINTSDYDTLSFDVRICKLNNNNGVSSFYSRHSFSYIKKYDLSNNDVSASAMLWFCVIKNEGSLSGLYYNNKIVDDVPIYYKENGFFKDEIGNTVLGKDEMPDLSNLNVDNWSYSYVQKASQRLLMTACDVGYSAVGNKYDYDINISSTLPCYYKSFENREDFDRWKENYGFDLEKNPNQDYGTHGFNPNGDYDNGEDYDLEVPKDLKCKGFDSSTIISSFKADKVLTWKQSDNLDVKDWYTEIYLREVGTFKRYIWSAKETFDSGYTKKWNLYGSVLNAKRKYTFKFDDIKAYPCTPSGEESGGISQITDYYVKMRNTYYDETTKRTHYSNWITWHIDDKGNVDCVENEDHDVTNTDKDDVKIDSDNYKPGEDYTNKNKDTTSDSFTLDSFLSYLRQAVDTVGEVPAMLGTVFSWLPAVFTTMIVCGIGLLVLLRILNR